MNIYPDSYMTIPFCALSLEKYVKGSNNEERF